MNTHFRFVSLYPAAILLLLLFDGAGTVTHHVYDSLPTNYDIVSDNTLSPNGLWRRVYSGHNPLNGTDVGIVGVRTPLSPTNGFPHVLSLTIS